MGWSMRTGSPTAPAASTRRSGPYSLAAEFVAVWEPDGLWLRLSWWSEASIESRRIMIKQLQTASLVAGLTLILVLVGCGSETALDPTESSVVETPSSTVEPEPETEELSEDELPVFTEEETWPSDPVIDVWYRLDFRGYAFCGPEALAVPGTPPDMIYYFNGESPGTFWGNQIRMSDDGVDVLGFARFQADGSIDYVVDDLDYIVNYQLVLRSDINFMCE